MGGFTVDLSGDADLVKKLDDLGGDLNRWGWNEAFRPAAYSFLPLIHLFAWQASPGKTEFGHRTYRLGSISGGYLKVRAVPFSSNMAGVMATSQFGSTQSGNDPYYGAFVNWGHEIWAHGSPTGKYTAPKIQEEQAFNSNKARAAALATANLRRVINDLWNKGGTAMVSGTFS